MDITSTCNSICRPGDTFALVNGDAGEFPLVIQKAELCKQYIDLPVYRQYGPTLTLKYSQVKITDMVMCNLCIIE